MGSQKYNDSPEIVAAPLIKDYNNITPDEIENLLKILASKENYCAPSARRKRNVKSGNSKLRASKKRQQQHGIPGSCVRLSRELNVNPMTNTLATLQQRNCLTNISNLGSGLAQSSPAVGSARCPSASTVRVSTEDSHAALEEETSDASLTDDSTVVLVSGPEEGSCRQGPIMIDSDVESTICLDDSEDSDVEFVSVLAGDTTVVEVNSDRESESTVENDSVLQEWRHRQPGHVPSILISDDDEDDDALQPLASSRSRNETRLLKGGSSKKILQCPVCFNNLKHLQASSTVCGHIFCTPCAVKSVQCFKKCPICNHRLRSSHVHPVYLNFL